MWCSFIEGISLFECLRFKHFDGDDDNNDGDDDDDSEDEIFENWQQNLAEYMAGAGRQANAN